MPVSRYFSKVASNEPLTKPEDFPLNQHKKMWHVLTQSVSFPAPVVPTHSEMQPTPVVLPVAHPPHPAAQTGHVSLSAGSVTSTTSQQELQAKILSLFNSGSGASAAPSMPAAPQPQSYSQMAPAPATNPSHQAMPGHPVVGNQGYMAPAGRLPMAQPVQRHPTTTAGINFDNPSVQKALDTLIQSGPPLPLVGGAVAQQPTRSQGPPLSMYPKQY